MAKKPLVRSEVSTQVFKEQLMERAEDLEDNLSQKLKEANYPSSDYSQIERVSDELVDVIEKFCGQEIDVYKEFADCQNSSDFMQTSIVKLLNDIIRVVKNMPDGGRLQELIGHLYSMLDFQQVYSHPDYLEQHVSVKYDLMNEFCIGIIGLIQMFPWQK